MQRLKDAPAVNSDGNGRRSGSRIELWTRIASGIVLVVVALAMTYAGPLAFAALVSGFVALMAWEWGRLVRAQGLDWAFAVQVGAAATAAILTVYGCPACALLTIVAGTCAVFLLRRMTLETNEAWWSAAGVYYTGLPAIALIWIRTDPAYGWHAILFIFIVVWTTDTAAYIFGRMIGGRLLAPRISPKKTWAGFAGGLALAVISGSGFAMAATESNSLPAIVGVSALLSLLAQLGDLGESIIKRIFGRKDSSGLIPGHGGVLDRVDGLLFAAMACALVALLRNPQSPGQAVLFWG